MIKLLFTLSEFPMETICFPCFFSPAERDRTGHFLSGLGSSELRLHPWRTAGCWHEGQLSQSHQQQSLQQLRNLLNLSVLLGLVDHLFLGGDIPASYRADYQRVIMNGVPHFADTHILGLPKNRISAHLKKLQTPSFPARKLRFYGYSMTQPWISWYKLVYIQRAGISFWTMPFYPYLSVYIYINI